LQQASLEYHQGQVPLVPVTANEARARIAQLSADPQYLKAYFAGDVDARRQMDALNEVIAGATDADALSGGPVEIPTEVTIGQGLRRQDILNWAASVRELWQDVSPDHCEQAISYLVSDGATVPAGLLGEMQRWKTDALNDPEFVKQWLNGDRWARSRMLLADACIALGTD
jgi:hypothetical protein